MKEQICTNSKQSQKLIELGLREDTADLYITKERRGYNISNKKDKVAMPAWSLARMIEIVKHYPTPKPEIWHDMDFFTEVYNELCHALVDGYCWDYWSDEKRKQEKDPQRNQWSDYAKNIREKLPTVFQCKTPNDDELIDFYEHEGHQPRHRDDRLGRIYRRTAKLLKEKRDSERKPECMLRWGRNIYGYWLVSLWAMNEKGEGCFEYEQTTGASKLSALWHLAKRLRKMGKLRLLRYIKKQKEENHGLHGRVKHFKIEQVTESYFLIRQRHTILFFIRYYDTGAEYLCPEYRANTATQARDRINEYARERGFDYRIHH